MALKNDTWMSRDESGLAPPRSAPIPFTMGDVRGVVLHHTAGTAPAQHRDCAGVWRGIQQQHFNDPDENYSDIAYNFGVCPHGTCFVGRGVSVRGAANGDKASNAHYVSCVVFGNSPQASVAVIVGVKHVRLRVFKEYGLRADHLLGHAEIVPTRCPGERITKAIERGEFAL